MNLCDDRDLFEQSILQTSEMLNMNPAIVEKDYYVTKMLRYLVDVEPNIIFKGGTSLSKCYGLIQRFSEDIDLNYGNRGEKLTEGMKKGFSRLVKGAGDFLGMELENPEEIRSRRDFNKYIFNCPSKYSLGSLKPRLIVETAIAIRSFPVETKKADSYIYQYLKAAGLGAIAAEYDLSPFDVTVQTKERTFVDKIFAICDYYLLDNITEHSRHLYDVYKLFPTITTDNTFQSLLCAVREVRKTGKVCPSAQDGCNIRDILYEIIDKKVYEKDYCSITYDLLFENVTYDEAISILREIASLDIWDM